MLLVIYSLTIQANSHCLRKTQISIAPWAFRVPNQEIQLQLLIITEDLNTFYYTSPDKIGRFLFLCPISLDTAGVGVLLSRSADTLFGNTNFLLGNNNFLCAVNGNISKTCKRVQRLSSSPSFCSH